MIRYSLKCANEHGFESWFKSADAFEKLHLGGMVSCPECGDADVAKSLMAPGVQASKSRAVQPAEPEATTQSMTNAPDPNLAQAIKTLRDHVEKTSDYVGGSFAAEARAMHEGETPQRPIYGEAAPSEAKKLIEDGVPALPLPFIPRQKTN